MSSAVGGESPPALVQTVKDGLALITHGIRSIFNNSLERPRLDLPPALSSAASLSSLRQQQLSPAVSGHTVSDDWQFITDMDELTRNYFQRWALTVQHDTDRLIATHRQRERFRNWEKTGAKAGVALLLDEELVLDMESQLGEFELIHAIDQTSEDDFDAGIPDSQSDGDSNGPLTESEWLEEWLAWGGKSAKTLPELCRRVFYKGVEPSLRCKIWPFLCGMIEWRTTEENYLERRQTLAANYEQLKARWSPSPPSALSNSEIQALVAERQHAVEKDVVRTDRSHPFYAQHSATAAENSIDKLAFDAEAAIDPNHGSVAYIDQELREYINIGRLRDLLTTYAVYQLEVGYVQGMNDIASPLLALFNGEAQNNWEPFWLFAYTVDSRLKPHNDKSRRYPLLDNFHQNQRGMRTRMILLTYLFRLMEPAFYRALERMDDAENNPSVSSSTGGGGGGPAIGGATSLIWVFRGLLLLWKRELMTGAAAGHSPSFHSIERLWEAYLAGCTLWTPFMDVWLTLAILKVSGIVAAVRNGTIISFEELLRAVHSLSLNIGDCDRVIASCHRLMVRFDSISRELGVKKLTAAPSLATDADRDGPTGYWALNQPFTAAAVQQQAPPESPNIRFRFREALAILQMESN